MYDNVRHPEHYQGEFGMEVIDVIENFTADLNGIEATDTGNIIKYACRWKKKNGVEDLEKIIWYCEHLINYISKQELIAKVREERAKEKENRESMQIMVDEINESVESVPAIHTSLLNNDGFEIEVDGGCYDLD